MIPEIFHFDIKTSARSWILSCLLLLVSGISLSCSQSFQPQVDYKPRLVLYSILFSDEDGVYVRVTSTEDSRDGGISEPVHGARVWLVMPGGYTLSLVDSTIFTANDTASFYFANFRVFSGMQCTLTASKQGFDSVSATVTVPNSSVTIPDAESYAILRHPDSSTVNPLFAVNLSGSTAAFFYQVVLEYRGFDSTGQFRMGYVDVSGDGIENPFIEVSDRQVDEAVDITGYDAQFHHTESLAGSLKQSHLYLDIIVTKIDDPLYRFILTSGRFANPLSMRTDKIIFSNVLNGVGLVGSAAVDTTRIYLF